MYTGLYTWIVARARKHWQRMLLYSLSMQYRKFWAPSVPINYEYT